MSYRVLSNTCLCDIFISVIQHFYFMLKKYFPGKSPRVTNSELNRTFSFLPLTHVLHSRAETRFITAALRPHAPISCVMNVDV